MAKKLPKGKKKIVVGLAMSPQLLKRIDRIAKAKGVSRSEFVTRLIEDDIDDEEVTAAALSNPTIMTAMIQAFAQPDVMRAMLHELRTEVTDEQLQLFSQAMNVARDSVQQQGKK